MASVDDSAAWDEWIGTFSSQGEQIQANSWGFWKDKSLRQQCLCFFAGIAVFLPVGLKTVTSFESFVGPFAEKRSALKQAGETAPFNVSATIERAKPAKMGVLSKSKAKKRFLAVNTGARLSLFSIEPDGSVASEPADVLSLSSIQDPGLAHFYQGSKLVVHPRLNVLYECSLDANRKKLLIYTYSFNEKGKLTRFVQSPFVFDVQGLNFRGGAQGIDPCLDATGTYLYFTQGSWGGATGQGPQIPYFRVDSRGVIEEPRMQVSLDLRTDQFYSISLEPGRAESNDLYVDVTTSESCHSRTVYHCEVLPSGSFEIDSQVSAGEGTFRVHASSGAFLRENGYEGWFPRSWGGLALDEQGRILHYYSWPTQGFFLKEMMPGYAVGLKPSADKTEFRLFTLEPGDDRPTATSTKVMAPRFPDLRKAVSNPENQQIYLLSQDCEGLQLLRVALEDGRLRTFGPQKLDDDVVSLSGSYGKVQILSL